MRGIWKDKLVAHLSVVIEVKTGKSTLARITAGLGTFPLIL